MPLRGELNSGDLAHIFQMLLLHEKAGTLEIAHEGVQHSLHFSDAGILVPFDRSHVIERALSTLCRGKRLSPTQIDKARFNARALKKDLLETLEHMGSITVDERVSAMRSQLEESVFELFFLRNATFEFREGEAPQDGGELDPSLALSPTGLILEAARRTDEWQYIQELVHSGADIYEAAVGADVVAAAEPDVELLAVFEACDGERAVDQIVETSGIARFQVFRRIAHLIERSFAREVTLDDLRERGLRALEDRRHDVAARLLERAIALGATDRDVHAGAGVACESLREPLRAAMHFLDAGRTAERSGDLEAAIEFYLRIRASVPTLVEARERVFSLRSAFAGSAAAAAYDAFEEGKELASILFELGRTEELALVLSGLVDMSVLDPSRTEIVADLAAQLGAFALAIDALLRASDQYSKSRNYESVTRCLKRAQTLDPSRADLSERVGLVERSLAVKRVRTRSTMRAASMIAGFAVLFVAYGKYSSAAMNAYAQWSIEDFVTTREFEKGRDFYGSICTHYPLTVPFLLALENLREIDVAERNHAEIERYRASLEAEQTAGKSKQAQLCLDAALNARRGGDYDQALRLLRRALDLSGADDPLKIATGVAELEEYLGQATRLRNEATFFRNAGRFDDAHARLLELIESYANAPGVADLTLPVVIESDPPRARIRIDGANLSVGAGSGTVVAETPFVLDLPHARPTTIELSASGFVPLRIDVDARMSARVLTSLPRLPDREAVLPLPASFSAAADGSLVVVAQVDGRVCALSPSTLETRWNRELPDLSAATASPAITPDAVLLPVTGPQLLRIDRSDGRTLGAITLPARGVSTPAVAGNACALALDDGNVAVCRGSVATHVTIDGGIAFGPAALCGDRFVLASGAGRIWILSQAGGLTAMPGASFETGSISAFAATGSTVLVGTSDGGLFVFDGARLVQTATVPVFPGRPVTAIAADATRPVLEAQGRLAAVDLATKTAKLVELDARLALGTSARVTAAGRDGLVHVLERRTLERVGLFSADAAIDMRGTCAGAFAVYIAAKGKVVGVLLER